MDNSFSIGQIIAEFRDNSRLQWLSLLVAALIIASITKNVSDTKISMAAQVESKLLLQQKLRNALEKPIPETLLASAQELKINNLSDVLKAQSLSTAEAQALRYLEGITSTTLLDARSSLIGTEQVDWGGNTFWQVRIEVNGRLRKKQLIPFLTHFDGHSSSQRLVSAQYTLNSAERLSAVIDILYAKE